MQKMVLVVDDDPGLLKLVRANLEARGYRVNTASDGLSALRSVEEKEPDLVVLDIILPILNGFEVCRRIREFSQVPIIMITASDEDKDIVRGLNIGADDYITKPFAIEEFLARVRVMLRRTRFPEEMPQPPLRSGDMTIDFEQRRVTLAGKEVKLTATEYRILCVLARNAGRVYTQDDLLSKVWGWEYRGDRHILQVAISRLRKKIKDNARSPRYILTRVDIGYCFRKD
jgi:two-component system KDP operon response regulator KdpE